MSVRCISQVLDRSSHAGTELLMLVVLADYSDDDGNSYPAVASLARKCRMSPRNANYILNALQASGEVRVLKNQGPMGTNRYRLMLSAMGESKPLKPTSATPEAGFPKPLKPTSDEPSLNRQEPSVFVASGDQAAAKVPKAKTVKRPICPHADIVAAYHEILPELARVKLMDAKGRKAKLAEFWAWTLTSTKSDGRRRATTADEALTWIRAYFDRARSNDFLMGRTARGSGHEGWTCDLDFLLTEKGKKQVIERTEVTA